eukprot:XP_011615492.1 PREDICTED: vasoactive intestinal polypeptide receptor 2-like [Takifugu rubripes]
MKVLLFLFFIWTCAPTEGRHPNCNFLLEVERDHAECLRRLREEKEATSSRKVSGCRGVWDSIACWERAEVGEIVTIPCPRVLKTVFGRNDRRRKDKKLIVQVRLNGCDLGQCEWDSTERPFNSGTRWPFGDQL